MKFFTSSKGNGRAKGFFSRENLKILFFLLIIIFLLALTFPKNRYSEYSYKVNDITRETIIAPFEFPILKSDKELETDRQAAKQKIPLLFKQDAEGQRGNIEQLNNFFNVLDLLRTAKKQYHESRQLLQQALYSKKYEEVYQSALNDSISYFNLRNQFQETFKFDTNSVAFKTLLNTSNDASSPLSPSQLLPKLRQILSNIFAQLVIDIPRSEIISDKIAILRDSEEWLEDPAQVLTLNEAWSKAKLALQAEFPEHGSEVINIGYSIIIHFLKPNLIFQKEITETRQKEAIDKVPLSKGVVLENEKIVDANTRVTPEISRKLESLTKERARQMTLKGGIRKSLPIFGDPVIFIGQFFLVALIVAFYFIFLMAYNPKLSRDLKKITLIGIIFIIPSLLSMIFIENLKISEYSIPITMAAMTLTILFDSRVAFVGASTLSVLIGMQLGGRLNFVIVSIFASAFAIYSVRKLRTRSQIFKTIFYIVLSYLIAITITELLNFTPFHAILRHYLFGSLNGVLVPFLTYGIIGLLEKLFSITTELTLLEAADFNHPLLKQLSREATGTFTHSVTVGNLSEAAADAIGANALLARVGSYYHDVGKITKPEYFVENQSFDANPHDHLAPNLSALIITNHIKDGIRLAEEYKLPKDIRDFIPTHHGTTRIEYFYDRALKKAKEHLEVNESDFRYPGPKPFTKEQGIVMLCESIEAATRSLKEPSLPKIEKIIDQIINKRIKEGQLDYCPLTFDDLRRLKGSIKDNTGILPILKGIFHIRVEYPDKKSENSRKEVKGQD